MDFLFDLTLGTRQREKNKKGQHTTHYHILTQQKAAQNPILSSCRLALSIHPTYERTMIVRNELPYKLWSPLTIIEPSGQRGGGGDGDFFALAFAFAHSEATTRYRSYKKCRRNLAPKRRKD